MTEKIVENRSNSALAGTDRPAGKWAEGDQCRDDHDIRNGPTVVDVRTIGWRPGCECGAGLGRPLVLDPFLGSGTVAEVARECGCDWVGCEINEQYAALARRRLRQGVLL